MGRTGGLWLLLGVVVVGTVGLYVQRRLRAERVREARMERQAPVLEVAPAKVPDGPPLLGKEGVDENGYPTRHVDRPALRSLLHHRRFAALTAAFERFQDAFERDPKHEYWPIDAADAFASAEPALRPLLDAWVEAAPDSFAPYLARGAHWTAVAYARRGGRYLSETAVEDLAAMSDTLVLAAADLERALALRPRLVAARRVQINVAKARSDFAGMREAIVEAERVCPTCFRVRVSWLLARTPRWGGSYEEMRAYVRGLPVEKNPRLALLAGYVDHDIADPSVFG